MNKIKTEMIPGIIAVILIIIAGLFFVAGNDLNPPQRYPIKELDDGWAIRYNSREIKAEPLSKMEIATPSVADQYSLSLKLTGKKIPGAAVYFRAFQSKVEAYLDGVLVYSQGSDALGSGRMPGRTLCFIPLPDGYIGKTLRIDITAAEKGAFTSLGPFLLGNQQDLFHNFLSERQLPHLFGTFLTLFALFQFLVIPYLVMKNKNMMKQFFSALLVLAAGTYMLAFYNLFNIYVSNPEVNTFLEFLSIYGIPSSMSGYLMFEMKGRISKIYKLFTLIDFLLLGAVLVLHFTNIIHISQSLMPMYALCVIEVIPFVVSVGQQVRVKNYRVREDPIDEAAEMIPVMGMMVFAGFSFIDMAYFLYAKNVLRDEADATIILAAIGGMLLAMSQMVSFLLQGVSFLRSEKSRRELLESVHTDKETGLSNRARFEQEMKDRRTSKEPYSIVCVHLDHKGKAGKNTDKEITAFADILREAFPKKAIICRLEEGEFVVIVDRIYEQELSVAAGSLDERVAEYNKKHKAGLQVSYGAAMSSEDTARGAYDIYLLADNRLFGMLHQNDRKRGVPVEA